MTNPPKIASNFAHGTASGKWSLATLLILSLLIPVYFEIAGLRLSATRILLLVAFVPQLIAIVRDPSIRFRSTDVFLLAYGFWVFLTLFVHHGTPIIPYAGITIVELLGGYLIARASIRSPDDFRKMIRVYVSVIVLILPFALLETFTNRNLFQEVFGTILPAFVKPDNLVARWGLERAMASFEHPILFGLFCSIIFASAFYVYRFDSRKVFFVLSAIFLATFSAMSSAPILSILVQSSLLVWAGLTSSKWRLLIGLIVTGYVSIDLLSNRTPITILINYITFDSGTAWTRIHIWRYGSAEMWSHPFVGIGMNNWTRPQWLTSSVDNFWLVNGMRYGAVGVLFLILGLSLSLAGIKRSKNLCHEDADLRRGYVISLVSLYLTLATVHVWGDTSVIVMFYIGAGIWFYDSPRTASELSKAGNSRPSSIQHRERRYTRQERLHRPTDSKK